MDISASTALVTGANRGFGKGRGHRGVAVTAVDGIAAGAYEILADETSEKIQAGLAGGVAALYPTLP
jgi:hypothetical protein